MTANQLSASPYLSGLLEQFGVPQPGDALELLATLRELDVKADGFAETLQTLKSKFDLAWAAEALSGKVDFAEHGRLRSDFAGHSIDKALHAAWYQELTAQRIKPTPLSGLFILGLGKLGGYDLNFSSDVDLIAYYDPQTLPISENKGQKYIINKVLQRLTRILKPNHKPDFVWRVDWRLRPESSAGGLAMAVDEASNFYFFRALPWHRLALMKARVIAGDREIGEAFFKELTPFIWRQNLDYRALDELAHLKTRINLEHPGLQAERVADSPIAQDPSGFNVKLGRGGIREIEFIVNAQQLVWGGKEYALRTTHTLTALSTLRDLGHITEKDASRLRQAYITLRQLENAIQMLWNDQTHIVPDSPEIQTGIADLLGAAWPALSQEIYTLRQTVNKIFNTLFQAEDQNDNDDIPLFNDLSPNGQNIAQSWLNGFDHHGVRRNKLQEFQPFGQVLMQRVLSSSAASDNALIRIDRFLSTLSRSEQYFHLLQRNPKLLDALILPLLYSPHMTVLLEQSPHIIDTFLDPQSPVNSGNPAPRTDFIFADEDYETRLERLRRFVNEYLFQYYHLFLQGDDGLSTLHKNLTRLAEMAISAAIEIVRHDLSLDTLPMTVLGLGKMGTARMAPQSDLDLIFIFDDSIESELAAKVVRRLRTAITTPLREGIAYELDMRLRPSGRSGPPAVKLSSLREHHMTRARTWEHIALIHSRIVAGDETLGQQVEAIRAEILTRPRDRDQCLMDAKLMWSRLADQRINDRKADIIDAKLRTGGLMQAEYLDACLKLLGEDSQDLTPAITFWSDIQIWERLLGLTGQPISQIPESFKSQMLSGKPAAFIKAVKAHEKRANKRLDALFGHLTLPAHYSEKPILWR